MRQGRTLLGWSPEGLPLRCGSVRWTAERSGTGRSEAQAGERSAHQTGAGLSGEVVGRLPSPVAMRRDAMRSDARRSDAERRADGRRQPTRQPEAVCWGGGAPVGEPPLLYEARRGGAKRRAAARRPWGLHLADAQDSWLHRLLRSLQLGSRLACLLHHPQLALGALSG